MMNYLRKFGQRMSGEATVLTACAALLVFSALLISPAGKAELDRTLSLIDGGGSQTALCFYNCSVRVYFTKLVADPNPTPIGSPSTISWSVNRGDFCVWRVDLDITGNDAFYGPTSGSWQTPPLNRDTTYWFKCYDGGPGNSGETPWTSISIGVYQPTTPVVTTVTAGDLMLSASPSTIAAGAQSIISWNMSGDTSRIDECSISGGRWGSGTPTGSIVGSLETGPLYETTVFGFNCHHADLGWLTPIDTPVYVEAACTSAANLCGMTRSGTVVGGVCSASTPPNTDCPACTSAPNACGMRNTGYFWAGACSANTPPNSQCPPPKIPAGAFTAKPAVVQERQTALITWSVTDATSCTLSSDSPAFPSRTVAISGSISSSAITQTTTFTLSCQNGEGGPRTTRSVRVVLTPDFQEI